MNLPWAYRSARRSASAFLIGLRHFDRRRISSRVGSPCRDAGGNKGDNDHGGDDVVDALVDVGHAAAERVAEQDHAPDPEKTTEDVVGEIARVAHFCGAG